MNFERVFEIVRTHLEKLNQPLALAGAFALGAHGISRATADLDLIVSLEAQQALLIKMEEEGFETLYFSEGFSNHLHLDPDLGRVDFIYLQGTTRERLFSSCELQPFGSKHQILVPKVEHLIAMKIHAIRNDPSRRLQDLADIERMLELPRANHEEIALLFKNAGLEKEWDLLEPKR